MRARKRKTAKVINFTRLRERAFRRSVLQFRLSSAGRLRGCIAEVMAAQDAADEALAARLDDERLDAQGLSILGRPIRTFIHAADY